MRKPVSGGLILDIGQHGSVEDNKGCVAWGLLHERGKITGQVACNNARGCGLGDGYGSLQPCKARVLSRPDKGFEPAYVLWVMKVERIQIQSSAPDDLGAVLRQRSARRSLAGKHRRMR